jgi:hypothetical protein
MAAAVGRVLAWHECRIRAGGRAGAAGTAGTARCVGGERRRYATRGSSHRSGSVHHPAAGNRLVVLVGCTVRACNMLNGRCHSSVRLLCLVHLKVVPVSAALLDERMLRLIEQHLGPDWISKVGDPTAHPSTVSDRQPAEGNRMPGPARTSPAYRATQGAPRQRRGTSDTSDAGLSGSL